MIPRASLLAICLFWMAYESHFSPQFFADTIRASLFDLSMGLHGVMNATQSPAWHTASSQ
jgi:hypothetical protein